MSDFEEGDIVRYTRDHVAGYGGGLLGSIWRVKVAQKLICRCAPVIAPGNRTRLLLSHFLEKIPDAK